MSIRQRGRREVAAIGNAPDSDAAAVVRDVLDEPIDRVIGVGALVGRYRARHASPWCHVDEVATGHESSPNVLIGEDEPFISEARRRSEGAWKGRWPVGTDAVGGPRNHYGIVARGVARHVHSREELGPITHRDSHFRLRITSFDRLGLLRGSGDGKAKPEEARHRTMEKTFHSATCSSR